MDILNLRNKNGITIISLVITIIVLLILAGISISTLTGDSGVIKEAGNAKEQAERRELEEQIDVAILQVENNHVNPTLDDAINELIKANIIESADKVNKDTGVITTKNPVYDIEGKLEDYIGENR